MSGQSGGRLMLSKLNEQLTCKLCDGYFIDATTIIECLHSFCRSCIVKYLNTNKYCPICEVQVHKSKPLLNIRPDHTLQDIVYKLVPGCYQNEMRCRRKFYEKHPEGQQASMPPEARGEPIESHIYSPDESLSLSLEYYRPMLNESPVPCTESEEKKTVAFMTNKEQNLPRRYLRCPAAVTVFHLQKLIRAKYGLSDVHRVDIMYKEEALYGNYTLMDVMYIYHWRRKVPLHLSYRIFESSSKRLKLSNDNEQFNKSLTIAGISSVNFDKELHGDGLKKEWKEVQLKISETGVMSVTGIISTDPKKNKKTESLEEEQRRLDKALIESTSEKIEQVFKRKTPEETSSTCTILELPKISNESQIKEHKLSTKVNANDIKNEKNVSGKIPKNIHGNSFESVVDKNSIKKALLENSKSLKESELKSHNKSKQITSIITKNNNSSNQAGGSKIDALSAKLQFQPKIGQVNNTYSKKGQRDRKTILEKVLKNTENKKDTKEKTNRTSGGGIIANLSNKSQVNDLQTTSNSFCNLSYSPAPSVSISITSCRNSSPDRVKDLSGSATGIGSSRLENSESTQQRHTNISANNESLASIGLNVSTALLALGQSSSSNYPYTVQDLVNNAMRKSPSKSVTSSQTSFNLQTPSMSIYSIPTFTAVKTTISSSANNSNGNNNSNTNNNNKNHNNNNNSQNSITNEELCASGTGKLNTKSNLEITGGFPSVPPCPDAIPISLMKPTVRKTEIIAKGTNLNEICAKIVTSGSKINDICAKIGETSKERDKNKSETKTRPEIPDLLKIIKKTTNTNNESSVSMHIPNIPSYTAVNTAIFGPTDSNGNKSIYTSSSQSTSGPTSMTSQPVTSIILKGGASAVKKQPQYKTLRDPPKSWNPTLSKNSYVATKNQAKEMHQSQGAVPGFEGGSGGNGNSKSIALKPAKIFKMRNVPRYLGNPASGVKPMYGATNDGFGSNKEVVKEPSSSTVAESLQKNLGSSASTTKTDLKTLLPIVSTTNSPIVSPPPYSPSARNYQNTPFPRDICRKTNSPLSPRNSPVNMLSTNPFIPSPIPNTNPRLIYSHYPSPFSDATKFTNPLIRSPIGMASPSAFHSSLPPSINKLYQRTSYMSPTSSGYGQNSVSQSQTVQRSPANPAPSKSPKDTSLLTNSNFDLIQTDMQLSMNSLRNPNEVDGNHQHGNDQELNAFNLTKILEPNNSGAGVASDLSKNSLSSSGISLNCTSNNQSNLSDEKPNNPSNLGIAGHDEKDGSEDSKKKYKNKKEEISSEHQPNDKEEKNEAKDNVSSLQMLNKDEQLTGKETERNSSVYDQTHVDKSPSHVNRRLEIIDDSKTTQSSCDNLTEKFNTKTTHEPGLALKEKENELVEKKLNDSEDHLVKSLTCDSLMKSSNQMQEKKSQTEFERNKSES